MFAHGFISPDQQRLIRQAKTFCLDATHSISKRYRDILYTIVIRNDFIDGGHPVAYMVTNDHSIGPIVQWLTFWKENNLIVNPAQITIDRSESETNAIKAVFPDCGIQYCLFHVAQAWGRQLNNLDKSEPTPRDNCIVR